jgi:predicted alternative tryptophan synthase beta-subunit
MCVKITLDEKSVPGECHNTIPDLPFVLPSAISYRTGYPIGPHDLEDLSRPALMEQELDTKHRTIRIPDAVAESHRLWRPALRINSAVTRLPTVQTQAQR